MRKEKGGIVYMCMPWQTERQKGPKEWAPCYYPKRDLDRLKVQWDTLGIKFANQPFNKTG